MIRSNVLLPQPLSPTTPMRSPSLTVSDTSSNNGRLGREARSPWASIKITGSPDYEWKRSTTLIDHRQELAGGIDPEKRNDPNPLQARIVGDV